MTRCDYTVTYGDFKESVKLYRRVSRQALVAYWLSIWVLPVVCIAGALTLLVPSFRYSQDIFSTNFWIGCIALGAGVALPLSYRTRLQRAFRQRNVLTKDQPMFCEFDENAIRFVVPGGTEISYPWDAFSSYSKGNQVIVVFIKDAAFHTIPTKALNETASAELDRILTLHPEVKPC